MSDTVDGHTLKNAATALWEAGVLPMSGDQADKLAEALAAAGLLAAPAARLPKGAAGLVATTVHNALCDCMGSNTGITLRSSDWELVRDAVAALLESWQGASPAAPADDEAAAQRVAAIMRAHVGGGRFTDAGDAYCVCGVCVEDWHDYWSHVAVAALREGQRG